MGSCCTVRQSDSLYKRVLLSGVSWIDVFYIDGALIFLLALTYFHFGDDTPDGSGLFIDRFRPWRFSNTISQKELKVISSSRLVKKSTEKKNVPWCKLFFSKDILLFSAAWFFATFVCKYSYDV